MVTAVTGESFGQLVGDFADHSEGDALYRKAAPSALVPESVLSREEVYLSEGGFRYPPPAISPSVYVNLSEARATGDADELAEQEFFRMIRHYN